ncbi:hypothetical protein GCM10009850_114160 [Nonomuraea monospora]|uniref:Uncharacterized protein n=1 Tax=Nonomuraea monospora TaxID=568818 RepID=A0ABN3D2A5_9ACTN
MTSEQPRSGLPVEFLCAIAAEASPGSPPIRMATERTRALPEGRARDALLLILLLGAHKSSAPEWMLKAAIESDIRTEGQAHESPSMRLATAALSNPSCSDALREEALRLCSSPQLAVLGRKRCGELLAQAMGTELRRREPHGRPMTPELLEEPSASQVILREPDLHDTVFSAALDLLPQFPPGPRRTESETTEDFLKRHQQHMAAWEAWETMWGRVVELHTDRHRQLVEWAQGSRAFGVIRDHLLGAVPWDVEPSLLEEIAARDLAEFEARRLITRLCRMLRDGLSELEARSLLADELDALDPDGRRYVERFFGDSRSARERGLRAAVYWMEATVDGSWRHILNPADGKTRYGESHAWRAPQELLVVLGQRFAVAAANALDLWEPDPDPDHLSPSPQDVRWIHALLLHLPDVTDEVKDKARAVVQHFREAALPPWARGGYKAQEDHRQLAELCASIERMLDDPAAATRSSALGDPAHVTVRELAGASDEALRDYLARHAGDDDLVEKTLLSFASHSHRPAFAFPEVLAFHSAPETALIRMTTDLRKRLGGGPALREAWTRLVLALPDCPPHLVRALPAWTALTVGGPETVVSVVLTTLGNDDEAWNRFATSPASYTGATAWLRLGDVLDAAATSALWPDPPSST